MITLVFVTTGNPLSRLIRWITGSKASHCAIGGLHLEGVPVVLHASLGGVQLTPRERFYAEHRAVAEYEMLAPVSVTRAVEALGDHYDYVGLAGYLPVLLWRWLGRKMKNPFAGAKASVCSELLLALDSAGVVPEWAGLDPETTTPEDLLRLCAGSSFRELPP